MKFTKNFFIKIIILSTLLLPFIGIEYFMSILNFPKSEARRYIRLREMAPSANVVLRFPEEPEGKELKSMINLTTDEDGYILPYGSNEEESIKILFLGGSTTECIRLGATDRFPYLVAKKLTENYRKDKLYFKSLNSGNSGNNSMHSNFIFLAKGITKKPDFAIMMHNVNDLSILLQQSPYRSYWNNNPTRSIIKNYSFIDSTIYPLKSLLPYTTENIIKPAYHKLRRFKYRDEFRKSRSIEIDLDPEKIKKDFENSLNTFVTLTRTWGVEPILMTQASRLSDNPEDWISSQVNISVQNLSISGSPIKYEGYKNLYDSFNEIIRKVSNKRGVKLIDLAEEIPKSKEYLYDLVHLNQKGSKLVSEVIVREFINSNLIQKYNY